MPNRWPFVLIVALLAAIVAVVAYKRTAAPSAVAETTLAAQRCTPGITPCRAALPGGGSAELGILPTPVRPLQPLALSVSLTDTTAEAASIVLDGATMSMGAQTIVMTGKGVHFAGEAMLPVCITGEMEWAAHVRLETPRGPLVIPFHFMVAGTPGSARR